MQSTTRLHNDVANTVLQEAYLVFHDPIAFHSTNRVFDTDANRRDHAIVGFFRWGEFTATGLFLGLNDDHPVQYKALESHILIEVTPAWQGITGQLRKVFVMFPAFYRITQEANVTGLIDHEEVFDRVALFLATVIFLLFLWIARALDRSLSTIMPKRGA
jgi:hypothetical protein